MSALRASQHRAVQSRGSADLPERERRPKLSLLSGGKHRSRFAVIRAPLRARSAVPFALICIGLLVSSLVAVLVMTTWMANGSYEMTKLQRAATRAAQDAQMLHEQVRAAQAELPAQAAELGMVPAQQPIALDVSSAIVFTSEQMAAGQMKAGQMGLGQ